MGVEEKEIFWKLQWVNLKNSCYTRHRFQPIFLSRRKMLRKFDKTNNEPFRKDSPSPFPSMVKFRHLCVGGSLHVIKINPSFP